MDISQQILSDITVFNKYAKFLPDQHRRENWKELCDRNKGMHLKKYPQLSEEIEQVYSDFVEPKKVLPSMRSIQFGGRPIELASNRIFNCAYMPIDDIAAFWEAMFLLLGGSGVGYSVQKRHVSKLPQVIGPTNKPRRFLIGDSIEGWADSIRVLIRAYFEGRSDPVFDFRDIRHKGARLVTSGGKAPGPDPLRICIDHIRAVLNNAVGRKLQTIEAHDIMCHIADSVLSGGIRRAALIALFSKDDLDMLSSKSGNWRERNPQRGRANNSVVFKRGEVSYDEFIGVWDRIRESYSGEPGVFWTNDYDLGTNPCLIGSTVVATADGRNGVTIEQLAKESKGTIEFPVYSARKKHNNHTACWKTEISNAVAFKTGTKEVIEIVLSDGSSFKCTPDHKLATKDGRWVAAEDSEAEQLQNFYSFSNKNTNKSYRHICSTSNGYARQYRMMWEFNNGSYDTTINAIDHIDDNSKNDCLNNLQLISLEDHKVKTKRIGLDNPIHKCDAAYRSLYSTRSNIYANGAKYGWSNDRIQTALDVFDKQHGSIKRDDVNVYLNQPIFVKEVIWSGEIQDVYDLTVANNSNFYIITNADDDTFMNSSGVLVHNCAEISLKPCCFCNLTEINVSDVDSQHELNARSKAAAFLGTLQAGYTDFHYLRPIWRENTEKDALLGVSQTGIGSGKVLKLNLEEATKVVNAENMRIAATIGINQAARTTTVKPAGTTSLTLGTASGVHAWHNDYYIRRQRVGKTEALYHYMLENFPELVEDCKYKPHLEAVMSFPQHAPEGSIFRYEPALALLERVKKFNQEWIVPGHHHGLNNHNVSCTISLKDDEWKIVGDWMWVNKDFYTGIAVLPYDNGSYVQAPFEDCTKETFEELSKHLHAINLDDVKEFDDNTNLVDQAACAGGVCEII